MPSTSETIAIRATAISTEPWDHWAIIRAKPFARPDVVTALLMRPTVTSRTAVMIDVWIPSIRAREMRLGPIRWGVAQLTAMSVAIAAQTAKLGVLPVTRSHVMTPSGRTKFRAPPHSFERSTAVTSLTSMSCFMASMRMTNATERK